MDKKSEILEKRKSKILELKKKNINLFPNDFVVQHTIKDIKKILAESPETVSENDPIFTVAGRMMAINRFGKASFIRFRDRSGQLQAYIRKDKIG